MCWDHRPNSISSKVFIIDFRLNVSISMFLRQIRQYLFIECFNFYEVFCVGFLLEIPFRWCFYILDSLNIHFTRFEIHKFMTPKQFLQLKSILIIYRHIKNIHTNYIVYIRYPRYQIYKLQCTLLSFLVDGIGGSHYDDIIIVSLITLSVLIHLQ